MSHLVLRVAGWTAFWAAVIVLFSLIWPYLVGAAAIYIFWCGATA